MMFFRTTIHLLFSVILLAQAAPLCGADGIHKKCKPPIDPQQRTGYPQCISPLARPSESPHECGYWVGGGAPHHGEGRCVDEGTWGWDYSGILFPKRVALLWWHGQREQGGSGAYKTDGPKLELKH